MYCFEEADNGQGLASLYLESSAELQEEWRDDVLGGTMLIRCRGKNLRREERPRHLRRKSPALKTLN
ncbi:MAG: hypothetical protein LBD71_07940 [Treponema sp.]|nr:hypothetical protein [Treponema sp.]